MLNIFPIQFLAPFAYFLLRVCLGIICITLGIKRAQMPQNIPFSFLTLSSYFTIIEIATGIFLILGAYTQLAALSVMALSVLQFFAPASLCYTDMPPRIFFVLSLAVSISLFITGAGTFAFDLPI